MTRAMTRPRLDEEQLQDAIIKGAHVLGWRVAHFRPAQARSGRWLTPVAADGKGFPDLVLVRERVIFAELKGDGGRVSAEQAEWLSNLARADAEVYLWTADAWRDESILRTLARR
jgi:hypothetical protein